MHEAVEQGPLLARLLRGVDDDDEAAGQDLDVIGIAPEARGAPLDVGVVALTVFERGVFGAALLWAILFKVLIPRERVLSTEDTEMTGVLAKVSDSIRSSDGIGEILFVQTGARRSSAARSDDGRTIERGTEVVVIRYERGIAYVRPWAELEGDPMNGLPDRP